MESLKENSNTNNSLDPSLDLNEGLTFNFKIKAFSNNHKSNLPNTSLHNQNGHSIHRKRNRSPLSSLYTNKKRNITLNEKITTMLERVSLGNSKPSRGIKIFSDMSSSSSISRNLFKNFHPCIIPEYYPSQIKTQVISTQIAKIRENFHSTRILKLNQTRQLLSNIDQAELKKRLLIHNPCSNRNAVKHSKKDAFNNNSKFSYLQQIADQTGMWLPEDNDFVENECYSDEDDDSDDSNNEKNSNCTYPEDGYDNEDDEEDDFERMNYQDDDDIKSVIEDDEDQDYY